MKAKKILSIGCACAVLGTAAIFAACNGDNDNKNSEKKEFQVNKVVVPDVHLVTVSDESSIAEILNTIKTDSSDRYSNLDEVYLQVYSKTTESSESPSGGSYSITEEQYNERKAKKFGTNSVYGDYLMQNLIGTPFGTDVFMTEEEHSRADVSYTWSTVEPSYIKGGYLQIDDNGMDIRADEFSGSCNTVANFLNPEFESSETITDLIFKVDNPVQPMKIYMSFVVTDESGGSVETRELEMYYDFAPSLTYADFHAVEIPELFTENMRYFTPIDEADFSKEKGDGSIALQGKGNGPLTPKGIQTRGRLSAGGYEADVTLNYSAGNVTISESALAEANNSLLQQAAAAGDDISAANRSLYIDIEYVNTDCANWAFGGGEFSGGTYMYSGSYFFTYYFTTEG